MAKVRFSHLDDFVLKDDGKVGIQTSLPSAKVEVAGTVRAGNLKSSSGMTTFISLDGYVNQDMEYSDNVTIDSGESGTLSGEIVIGAGLTMTVGTGATTGQGTIESVKVSNTFNPPIGGTNDRPSAPQPGALYYNKDFKTIEYWDGNFWRQVDNTTSMGRGIWCGGVSTDKMEYLTIQSKGKAEDFGNLTLDRDSGGSCSSSTRGVIGGAIHRSPLSETNIIDYVEIATLGNALDFGDISYIGGVGGEGFSSPTRGFWCGGGYPSISHDINVITIASKGDSTKFGEIAVDAGYQGQASNNTRGITAGGLRYSPYRNNGLIQYLTMASEGNATDFGDLTLARHNPSSVCTHVRACFSGGYVNPGSGGIGQKLIDYIQFASTGNAMDFGEISTKTYMSYHNGTSDSHGGLGGF